MNTIQKRLLGVTAATAASFTAFGATTAGAGGPVDQDGLVNVFLDDINVQVPVALAANICEVDVNVIATQYDGGQTTCDAFAEADAVNNAGGRRSGGGRQDGLVNLYLTDVNVQVPVGVALNLCDIDVNVLALQAETGDTTCNAEGNGTATNA